VKVGRAHDTAEGASLDPSWVAWVAARVGAAPVASTEMAPGLGHRRFLRLRWSGPPGTAILRVDPPDARPPVAGVPPEPPLEPIRAHLESAGLPVPRSYGHDAGLGLDLLEDVGDRTLEAAAHAVAPAARRSLYDRAAALIVRIQAVEPPEPGAPAVEAFARRLDRALIASKAHKVIHWLLPEALGREATAIERRVVERGFDDIAEQIEAAPARLAHRDYKAANIHLRPGPSGDAVEELVLIDLQGAFMAPPEYDLVCLLRDSHVPLADALVDELLETTLTRLPARGEQLDARRARFDALTLSRVGKDLAHYLDAATHRGDDRYLAFVEVGLARLRVASQRLVARDARWRDLGDLLGGLPRPARCADAPAPEWLT
jgi:hypothetical protein